MIELAPHWRIAVAGLVAVAAAGWASWVSVRSAAGGPRWALDHFGTALRAVAAALPIAAVAAVVLRPVWVGLVMVYVVVMVGLVAWLAGRHLRRLATMGGLDPIDPERSAAIVLTARRSLLVGGGVLVGLAGIGLRADAGAGAWVIAAVGMVVAANGLLIGGLRPVSADMSEV